jgi:cbb3-type cytochrome oxidase subunit 3
MLSQLFRQMFDGNPITALPSIGLALFMIVFAGVTISVLRRRSAAFDDVARLPLDDEEVRHER